MFLFKEVTLFILIYTSCVCNRIGEAIVTDLPENTEVSATYDNGQFLTNTNDFNVKNSKDDIVNTREDVTDKNEVITDYNFGEYTCFVIHALI